MATLAVKITVNRGIGKKMGRTGESREKQGKNRGKQRKTGEPKEKEMRLHSYCVHRWYDGNLTT